MKRFSRSALSAMLLAGLAACGDQATTPVLPGDAPVRLSEGEAPLPHLVLFSGSGPADFSARVAALGGTVEFNHPSGIAVVAGLTDAAAAELRAGKGIADVQRDEAFHVDVAGAADAPESVAADAASAAAPATALFYPRQWGMRAIGADRAWAAGRLGSSGVTVAILDTGIDYTHPDLAGLVDLSRSVSFVPSDDRLAAARFPGRHPVIDLRYHGTHVAATVSSNALNAAGMTSRVKLMGVKVLDVNGNGSFNAVIQGVLYAADNGADVINMSLSGAFGRAGNGRYVGYINKVFGEAHRKGVTVVLAAGNDARDFDHDGSLFETYCSAQNTVCVAATGPTGSAGVNGPFVNVDAPAPYTNFGRSAISVAAPGGSQSYVWAACSRFSLIYPVCGTGAYVLGLNGTSMAAPHV
ncbi:MAG TPA: S8 family serine peptidase, partial [Longimicrobiaceae bacterium]